MNALENFDQLVDRVAGRLKAVQAERDKLQDEVNLLRTQIKDKEVEHIRSNKELQRSVEQLERDKLGLQKERSQLESRLKGVYEKLKGLLPGQPEGVAR